MSLHRTSHQQPSTGVKRRPYRGAPKPTSTRSAVVCQPIHWLPFKRCPLKKWEPSSGCPKFAAATTPTGWPWSRLRKFRDYAAPDPLHRNTTWRCGLAGPGLDGIELTSNGQRWLQRPTRSPGRMNHDDQAGYRQPVPLGQGYQTRRRIDSSRCPSTRPRRHPILHCQGPSRLTISPMACLMRYSSARTLNLGWPKDR